MTTIHLKSARIGCLVGIGLLAAACGLGEPDFCNQEVYGGGPGAVGTALESTWADLAPQLAGDDRRVCVSEPRRTVVELSGRQLEPFFAIGDQLKAQGYVLAWFPETPVEDTLQAIYLRGDDGVEVHAYYRPGWDLTSLELDRRDREYVLMRAATP